MPDYPIIPITDEISARVLAPSALKCDCGNPAEVQIVFVRIDAAESVCGRCWDFAREDGEPSCDELRRQSGYFEGVTP